MDLAFTKVAKYYSDNVLAYTDEQAQDAVGYILNTDEFTYSDEAPSISLKTVPWSKIVGAPQIPGPLSETDPTVPLWVKGITASQINQWSQAYSWGNHALQGYLKTFTEVDPIFTASPAYSITTQLIQNWNVAYQKSPTSLSVTSSANQQTLHLVTRDGLELTTSFTAPNNYVSAAYFSAGILTLERTNLASISVNLDGRYLQTYTESDPTVASWIKAIPRGTTPQDYLHWDGAAWVAKKPSYLDLTDVPSPAQLYTDEQAQDAVAGMLLSGNHLGLQMSYNDNAGTFDIQVTAGVNRLAAFVVGNIGAAMAGNATTFTHPLLAGRTEANIQVFVDGLEIMAGLKDRFSFDISENSLIFTAPLKAGRAVKVYLLDNAASILPPAPTTTTSTTTAPPLTNKVLYGASLNSVPTSVEIQAAPVLSQNPATVLTIDWTALTPVPKYCWFALPQPYTKTAWYGSTLSNGPIGGVSDTFGPVKNFTLAGITYNLYVTQYTTQFNTPIQIN
jgi:hypothetical protein